MRPLISKSFLPLCICLAAVPVLAGSGLPKPKWAAAISLRQMKQLDSVVLVSRTTAAADQPSASPEAMESGNRICSCQVLNLESSNYHQKYMVLLAEKSNHGREADFRIARNRLKLEKKQLKKMFYDKVKVISELQSTGSCKSLYFRLRKQDSHLQLFEILNVD